MPSDPRSLALDGASVSCGRIARTTVPATRVQARIAKQVAGLGSVPDEKRSVFPDPSGHDHGSSSGDHNITVAEAKKSAANALRIAFDRQKLKAYLRKLLYQYACTSSSRQPPVSVDRQGRPPPTGRRTHSRDIRRRLSIGGRGCRYERITSVRRSWTPALAPPRARARLRESCAQHRPRAARYRLALGFALAGK
jgi:hypothetical protein